MEEIIMDNEELINRLSSIVEILQSGDRDVADEELYNLFGDLEFISEDYDEDDEDYDDDYSEDEE
jgi:hypothetical protein